MRILLPFVWLLMLWFVFFVIITAGSNYPSSASGGLKASISIGQEVFAQVVSASAGQKSAKSPQASTAEKDIFIHIHSGLKTMPVRKVIGVIINQAEEKGVKEIVGNGKHLEWDVWDITLTLLKEKATKELMWRYGRESWNIEPMNEEAKGYSFPLDKYVMGPAINMALGMIEGEAVEAEEILGRGEKLQDGVWRLSLRAVDTEQGAYIQKWLYNSKSGEFVPQQFDHSDLDKALACCVTAKGVNYSVLKKDANLGEFLKKVSKVDKKELEALPKEEQIAFWINVYNAIVLKRVADRYPVKSVKEIKGFFDKEKLKVAGQSLTLDDIRSSLLNKDFQERRALFALVSGTKSSPPLRKEAYYGRLLEKQLEEDLKSFLNQHANCCATEAGILISPVLEPLASGEGPPEADQKGVALRDFLNKFSGYLPPAVSKSLKDGKKEIKFMEYNWALNAGD